MFKKLRTWLVRLVMKKGYIDFDLLQRAKDKGIVLLW